MNSWDAAAAAIAVGGATLPGCRIAASQQCWTGALYAPEGWAGWEIANLIHGDRESGS